MNPDDPDLAAVHETLDGYLALGNQVIEASRAQFVVNQDAPRVYDANFVSRVRARTPQEITALFAEADQVFGSSDHRRFICDSATPPTFEARLVLEGYRPENELELLLEGELLATSPAVELRLASSEDDWAAIQSLTRLDHLEEVERFGRPDWGEALSRQLVDRRRAKGPAVRTWIASVDAVDCAFFSSWPGTNGVGKVEDLFTRPDFRHRGIATALIAHAVADARQRGAGPVVIGALPDDTPKHMYVKLGFRPFSLRRGYLKT